MSEQFGNNKNYRQVGENPFEQQDSSYNSQPYQTYDQRTYSSP